MYLTKAPNKHDNHVAGRAPAKGDCVTATALAVTKSKERFVPVLRPTSGVVTTTRQTLNDMRKASERKVS